MVHRKNLLVVLLMLNALLGQSALSQDGAVSAEVKDVKMQGDNELLITYEIKGDPEGNYAVEVFLLSEKDPAFNLKLKTLKGDLAGRICGRLCQITWNFSVDYPNAGLEDGYLVSIKGRRVDVERVESGGGWPWYYFAGGAVLVGGAVVLLTSGNKESSSTTATQQAAIPTPPLRP